MNGSDTWLKLHTSLLLSEKIDSLPDNEHRWAYCCCLMLAKKSIPVVATGFVAGMVRMGLRRWKTVRNNLIKAELVSEAGKVIGFEDSQLSGSAVRMRRHRARHSDATVTQDVTQDVTGEVEVEVEKKPPNPPEGGNTDPPKRRRKKRKSVEDFPSNVRTASLQIVEAINHEHGLDRGVTVPTCHAVSLCLDAGFKADDVVEAAKHRLGEGWWEPRKHTPASLIRVSTLEDSIQRAKEARQDEGILRY